MKTITMRTVGVIFSAGILLTSCVSSKKYHRSQDEVAKLRNDSTTLANQSASLQQNLNAEQQKNSDLQKTVQNDATANAGLQKNVAYYHDYFDKQQASTTQVKDELTSSLTANGLTDQDITAMDGKVYVNISEKNLFKGRTATLTAKGKELVDNLGTFVKNHHDVDVSVADLQQATDSTSGMMTSSDNGTMMNQNSNTAATDNNSSATTTLKTHHNSHNYTKTTTATQKNDGTGNTTSAADKTATKSSSVAVVHHKRKAPATSGESKSMAYSSGHHNYSSDRKNMSMARATAWKRQTIVADALLKTGIPKVKVVSQLEGTNTANGQKGVQVVLVPDNNFYKHMREAPASGQPVSMNP